MLKNLTPLVVGNVLGGKNLLIFGTINDLPGTSVLDVTRNHNLSTSKFDCLLVNCESRRAPESRRQYWRHLGWSSTDDSSEKSNFLLSNLPSGCGPCRTQHGFLAVLALVSGQQYNRGVHCEEESDLRFLTKQASLAYTPLEL